MIKFSCQLSYDPTLTGFERNLGKSFVSKFSRTIGRLTKVQNLKKSADLKTKDDQTVMMYYSKLFELCAIKTKLKNVYKIKHKIRKTTKIKCNGISIRIVDTRY